MAINCPSDSIFDDIEEPGNPDETSDYIPPFAGESENNEANQPGSIDFTEALRGPNEFLAQERAFYQAMIQSTNHKIQGTKTELAEITQSITMLEKAISQAHTEDLAKLTKELELCQQAKAELEKRLQTFQAQLQQLSEELTKLTTEISQQADSPAADDPITEIQVELQEASAETFPSGD